MEDASNKTQDARRPAKRICGNCARFVKDGHRAGYCGGEVVGIDDVCGSWQEGGKDKTDRRLENYTPGPWRVVANFSRSYVCYGDPIEPDETSFPPSQAVCGCGTIDGDCGAGNNTANSYLIAAAPEMYQLLLDIYETRGQSFHFSANLKYSARLTAILQKARGEA